MNLQALIPTLQCACSCALTNHDEGVLTASAGIAIAFARDGSPLFLFLADTTPANCQQHDLSGYVVRGQSMVSIVDSIAGLGLDHDAATSRMACAILSQLGPLLYALCPPSDLLLTLAGTIDRFTVEGIVSGIASAKKSPSKQILFTVCQHPERN